MAHPKNNAKAVNSDRERIRKVYDRSLRDESKVIWKDKHGRLVQLCAELYKMHQDKSEEYAVSANRRAKSNGVRGHARSNGKP